MKQREILERRRLQLEIKKLESSLKDQTPIWWVRPVYLSILAPLVVGATAFAWSYYSGVYDAERRLAIAEAAISELDLDRRERELQRERELLELRQAVYLDQRDAFAVINERICSAQSALSEFERPWRITDWTSNVLDIAEYEIQSMASGVEFVKEILESSESDDDELIKMLAVMTDFIESANLDALEFSEALAAGRQELGTQVEVFNDVYRELGVYCRN